MTTEPGAAAPEPQPVVTPLTGAAIFLVAVLTPGASAPTFIGYARAPATIEQMLVNMFAGSPEGNYDRLLGFSTAATGNLFFVPAMPLLENLRGPRPVTEEQALRPAGGSDPAPGGDGGAAARPGPPGTLTIGSLKGAPGDG